MATNGRNPNGTFAAGHKFATGRKGYGFETKFKKIFGEVFDEPTVKAACIQLKSHIFGQKVDVRTGQIVDDIFSTPQSRISAWTKMAEYAFGKPIQPVVMGQDEDGELMELLRSMASSIEIEKEEKLDQYIADMRAHLSKLNDTDAEAQNKTDKG